jgi:hypothetical protein
MWIAWDVTALVRAWMAQDVPNFGLAVAPAPFPDAGPDLAGDLLLARWFTAGDPETAPYNILDYEVSPSAAAPTAAIPSLLPPAGEAMDARVTLIAVPALVGLIILGAALATKRRSVR